MHAPSAPLLHASEQASIFGGRISIKQMDPCLNDAREREREREEGESDHRQKRSSLALVRPPIHHSPSGERLAECVPQRF